MNYAELRQEIKSGDAIMVEGRSLISRMIRGATGQNISHVGGVLWIGDNNAFMVEQREFKAFQPGRLSDRLQKDMKGCRVYHGKAPKQVRQWIDANHDQFMDNIFATRNEKYGYMELLPVLWAQWRQVEINPKTLVCSTWWQHQWEASGWRYGQTMDPGDFMDACEDINSIDLREFYA